MVSIISEFVAMSTPIAPVIFDDKDDETSAEYYRCASPRIFDFGDPFQTLTIPSCGIPPIYIDGDVVAVSG